MEKIKNFISPRTRRKKLDFVGGVGDGVLTSAGSIMPTPKTFGVSLSQLMARCPTATVPFVVSRICEFLYKYGLDNVGLFRVSGNVKIVERMRMQFELMGDVNFEEENDVAAVAGLLRVFLRDLPDTLVPAGLTRMFFTIVQGSILDTEAILPEIKRALSLMPEENFNVLKYICSLLVVVAEHKDENKMSSYALAIVFGPNLFKYELTSGVDGLKDMDSSKDVMQFFISQFNELFMEEGEPTPKEFWEQCKVKKSPPPRPPPPKLQSVQSVPLITSKDLLSSAMTTSSSSPSLDYRPIPSPRKIKNIYDSNCNSDSEGRMTPTLNINNCLPLFSPREDIDFSRAHSPFALESETYSIAESPITTARTHEFVEKTIVQTISEHIFGGMDFNHNSGSESPKSPVKATFDPAIYSDGHAVDAPVVRPRTSARTRKTPGHTHIGGTDTQLKDFDNVARSDILTGLKKPIGPPRRTPSKKHRRSWEGEDGSGPNVLQPDQGIIVSNGNFQMHSANTSSNNSNNHYGKNERESNDVDEGSCVVKAKSMRRNENEAVAMNGTGNGHSDQSSSNGIKLFIPPLDFTTLHEQVDGAEAVHVSNPHISPLNQQEKENNGKEKLAAVSPRSDKLKKRDGIHEAVLSVEAESAIVEAPMSPSAAFGSSSYFRAASLNTDMPPSPPVHQDLYKKHSDEDCSYRLRQLTKKIQGLKKKIKHYEDVYEKEHGFRVLKCSRQPSQGEKAAQQDIKKYMAELGKARKDLKQLKDDTEKGNRSRHNSGASSSGMELSPPTSPSVSGTLAFILQCLKEKRRESGRPEEVMLMNRDQIQEEKLAVQRALLHFEGLHGRPCSREEKDLMRPLYDRYRSIKRMLAKPLSPRNSLELQTVPEDQMIEIPVSYNRNAIHIPTAMGEIEEEGNPHDFGTSDFGFVTRDFNILRELDLPQQRSTFGKVNDTGLHQAGGGETKAGDDTGGDAHLHELSLSELHTEIDLSRSQKKKLRRCLKEFEDTFFERNGRKVQKEDRYPLEKEYCEYKRVKARLRLMEALVLKHQE